MRVTGSDVIHHRPMGASYCTPHSLVHLSSFSSRDRAFPRAWGTAELIIIGRFLLLGLLRVGTIATTLPLALGPRRCYYCLIPQSSDTSHILEYLCHTVGFFASQDRQLQRQHHWRHARKPPL